MSDEGSSYSDEFTDGGFWEKLGSHATTAGRDVVERALWLYYAYKRPDTPRWAKNVILGALGYFILPLDAIPDFTPLVGFADDLGVLAMAVSQLALLIDDEVKREARETMVRWFGEGD